MEETKRISGDYPAFASVAYSVSGDVYCQKGLTIREYFAAKMMHGLITNNFTPLGFENVDENDLAKLAVKCSDALIMALNNCTGESSTVEIEISKK